MKTREAIKSFLLDREARNLSPRTVEWYQQRLRPFAARYHELPEEPGPIREFLRDLRAGSDYTKHASYRALRALYNFVDQEYGFPLRRLPLFRHRGQKGNPIRRVTAPRVRPKAARSLDLGELFTLVSFSRDGAMEGKWALRDRTILSFLEDNGARVGELVGLTWQKLSGPLARVDGKTGEREVPVGPEVRGLLNKLKAWNDANFGPSDYVFLGNKGRKPLTRWGIYKVVRRAFERAGFTGPRLSPHTLRHTFGRNWIAEGGDQHSLQRILGHASVQTVQVYVNMNTKEMVRQHRRFSPLTTQARMAQGELVEAD